MKFLFIFLFLLSFSYCYADRVCIERATGKLIEYQSGDAQLGTLTQNAVNAGYDKKDIEEKYVTFDEWEVIRQNQIIKPIQIKRQQEHILKLQKEANLKEKLKLSDEEWEDLKTVLQK